MWLILTRPIRFVSSSCPTRGLWWLITFCWKSWPIFSLCIGTFLFLWQKKNFKTPKQKTNGYHKCFVLVWVTVTVFVCCKGGHLAFSAVFNKNKLKFLRKKKKKSSLLELDVSPVKEISGHPVHLNMYRIWTILDGAVQIFRNTLAKSCNIIVFIYVLFSL